MNNAKRAFALGAGYVLGRLRKPRWALALAGMAAGKKISTNPTAMLGELIESGQVTPAVDGTYPLSETSGVGDVREGRARGKVIITV